jgi:hypothetical protein
MSATLTFTATDASSKTTTSTITWSDAEALRIIAAFHPLLETPPAPPFTDPQVVTAIGQQLIDHIRYTVFGSEKAIAVGKVAPPAPIASTGTAS